MHRIVFLIAGALFAGPADAQSLPLNTPANAIGNSTDVQMSSPLAQISETMKKDVTAALLMTARLSEWPADRARAKSSTTGGSRFQSFNMSRDQLRDQVSRINPN